MRDDDLISLQVLLVSGSAADRDLMRRGVVSASVPVELLEAESAAAARAKMVLNDVDVVFADTAVPAAQRAALVEQARSLQHQPFVFLVAQTLDDARALAGDKADSVVVKPATSDEARTLVERCARLWLPNRVLVVDDSLTMRSIIRKILAVSRFRLDISEAHDAVDARSQIAGARFDIVLIDYNMPGLSGVEALSEIKRESPQSHVVLMSAASDDALATRVRRAGAAALLKKPFYPADIDAVLYRVFGLRAG
jgi:CheY-like chemotaxis protein